ncbi:MAG: hypothetical protein A3E80_01940 [Chlamydiae bacterium RIFCSPHIGHO2_12_FULL_49_9]|nr:MAG: hypothetical protein A3E80_01940 [Chlamydiae bacterium RIFCSPHIGHO2_12_FULL_49_9]
MKKIILLIFLTSCMGLSDSLLTEAVLLVHVPGTKKQRLKITLLEKKLEAAEKEKEGAELEVERLAKEIHEAQLALVRQQVDEFERKIEEIDPLKFEASFLFMREREMLHQMIQTGPSPSAFAAQVELDRILRLITEIGEAR